MRFGPFELGELISADGTTEVHQATCSLAGVPSEIALTRFDDTLGADPDFVDLFEVETRFALDLHHPHITRTYDFGAVGGVCYCAWELIRGIDIASLIDRVQARDERLPTALAVQIALAVAEALAHGHARVGDALSAVLHGGVTPRSVYLTFEGEIKLAGYGLAHARAYAADQMERWDISDCGYLAPEQVSGESPDARADLFGIGAILHELLSGRRLFVTDSLENTLRRVVEAEILPPSRFNSEVAPALDAVVMRALSRDISGRYRTADELGDELFAFAHADATAVMARDMVRWLSELAGAGLSAAGPMPWGGAGDPLAGSAPSPASAGRGPAVAPGGEEALPGADLAEDDDDQATTIKGRRRKRRSFAGDPDASTVRNPKMAARPTREDSRISQVLGRGPTAPVLPGPLETPSEPDAALLDEDGLDPMLMGEPTRVDFNLPAGMWSSELEAEPALGSSPELTPPGSADDPGVCPSSETPLPSTSVRYPRIVSLTGVPSAETDSASPAEPPPPAEPAARLAAGRAADDEAMPNRWGRAKRASSAEGPSPWRWWGFIFVLLMFLAGAVGAHFLVRHKRALRQQRPTSEHKLLDSGSSEGAARPARR